MTKPAMPNYPPYGPDLLAFAGAREKMFVQSFLAERGQHAEEAKALGISNTSLSHTMWVWRFDAARDEVISPQGVRTKVSREASASAAILERFKRSVDDIRYTAYEYESSTTSNGALYANKHRAAVEDDRRIYTMIHIRDFYDEGFEMARFRLLEDADLKYLRKRNNVDRPSGYGAMIDDLLTTAAYYKRRAHELEIALSDVRQSQSIMAGQLKDARQIIDGLVHASESIGKGVR